nr:MAG TPA_asm: hypothetical protein [Caudoviricetes sp.]
MRFVRKATTIPAKIEPLSDVTFIMNTDATMRQIYSKVST